MRTTSNARHLAIVVVALALFALLAAVARRAGGPTPDGVLVAGAAALFAWIAARLAWTIATAAPEARRRSTRGLVLTAAIPALMLTPFALDAAPSELAALIVLAALVWIALAMAWTSFLVRQAARHEARPSFHGEALPAA